MSGFSLIVVEEDTLPAILYVRSKYKPLVFGVFKSKSGKVFIQKCDKEFSKIKDKLLMQEFSDGFCSVK